MKNYTFKVIPAQTRQMDRADKAETPVPSQGPCPKTPIGPCPPPMPGPCPPMEPGPCPPVLPAPGPGPFAGPIPPQFPFLSPEPYMAPPMMPGPCPGMPPLMPPSPGMPPQYPTAPGFFGPPDFRLAHSYVPWQNYGVVYCPNEALAKGTLFPELFQPQGVYGPCEGPRPCHTYFPEGGGPCGRD